MLADCRSGKINRILTKSISRFARNTVTLLEVARELKELGVDIFFEKENIHSISGDGELMLAILASFAQEESRSVSENCKWRIRNDFKLGKPTTTKMNGLKIDHGLITPIPNEADIIWSVFNYYISGLGRNAIMRKLTALGIPAKNGGMWYDGVFYKILRNEKYSGALLLQKTFCSDHLAKRMKKNKGELPQYYIPDNHEAVVDRELFDRVQEILLQRQKQHGPAKPKVSYPFSGIIVCEHCGKHNVRKTTNGKISWQCSTFIQRGKSLCAAKQVPEETLIHETCEVLGLSEFDESVFKKAIQGIRIPGPNRLVYVFTEGMEVERVWWDRSRWESWSPEKRVAQRERTRQASERRKAERNE